MTPDEASDLLSQFLQEQTQPANEEEHTRVARAGVWSIRNLFLGKGVPVPKELARREEDDELGLPPDRTETWEEENLRMRGNKNDFGLTPKSLEEYQLQTYGLEDESEEGDDGEQCPPEHNN